MPLSAQQIVALANQAAKTPGFRVQAGQRLNNILQELCMTYDIAQARKTFMMQLNVGANGVNVGSGPYLLPADYLRTQNGKQFYLYNGQPYFMTVCDQWEFDALIQQPGFMDFPRDFYVDTSESLQIAPPIDGDFNQDFSPDFSVAYPGTGSQAQEFVWPPPSISVPVTIRYFSLMPDIPSPESSSQIPWFPYQQYLITRLTGEMMGLSDDTRAADFLTDDEKRNPQGAGVLLRRFLNMKDDPEGRAKTVELDRRRFGQSRWNNLPNTKTIGWLFAVGLLLQAFLPGLAYAQKTPAQLIAEIDANFPTNGQGFITAALARQTLTDMVDSMATTISSPYPVTQFGAKCDGVTDDTGAFQAGVTALTSHGGQLRVPDGADCIINGTVTIAADGIYFVGGGISGRDSAGSTITCKTATTANCFQWTNFTGGGLVNLRVDASARTGAACTVGVTGSSRVLFEHLSTIDNNSFCLTSTNTIIIDDVESIGPSSGSGKFWVQWIGTLSARSDVVIIQNSGYQDNNGGADCILWDGLANTMTLTSVRCLNVVHGIHTTNVNGNNSNYPAFLQAYDLEVDGGTGPAIQFDVGGWYRCIHCDLFHSNNSASVIINGDPTGTITRAVQFFGGRIGNSGQQCVTTGAQGVRFVGVTFGSCSLLGANMYPAIEVQSTAADTEFIGGAVVDFGDSNLASPGILLDNGSSRTAVIGLDLHYPTVPFVDNSTGQDNFWLPFIGQQSFLSFGKSASAGQLGYFYQINPGSNTTVRVENPRTATSTAARYELATGTPSSFADLTLTDGTTPQLSMTTGSGVTGGISLDASQATGGVVSLKSAAGEPITITSAVPTLEMQAVAFTSLPACVSGTAGLRATINNSTAAPVFWNVVAAAGSAFAPVICDGANWRYGG